MGEKTKIAWTAYQLPDGSWAPGYTFNPWIGCQKVSPGCDFCYAETQNAFRKWNGGTWGPHAPRKRTSVGYWDQPLKWARQARELGVRPKVFCASLADWLDNQVAQEWRIDLGRKIAETPELDWLLLTKRIENYTKLAPWEPESPPKNVWLGITAEDQDNYFRRWGILQRYPATVRFISYEPALGRLVQLRQHDTVPDWLLCGGESGSQARCENEFPGWARSVRELCRKERVAFFMKQMVHKKPIPSDLQTRDQPEQRRS